MAALGSPTITIDIDIADDCKSFELTDTTGAYNASTNPGGYGGGVNIPTSAVTTVKVRVYQYGDTTPTLFTFTVNGAGTITAATWTTPAAVTTSILADLTAAVWPFTVANNSVFNITNEYLGFEATDNISDQVWTISYEIQGTYSNDGNDYDFALVTSNDELVDCNTCCCVKKMAANLKTNCCECGDSLMTYLKAKAMLDSAKASADVGEYDAAQKAITKAADICDNSCVGCP